MAGCESDRDCNGTLVCFKEVPWSSDTNFCDCEYWHGWTGKDCLSLGPGAKYYLSSNIIQTLVIIFLMIYALKIAAEIHRSKFRGFTLTSISLILAFLALCSILAWRISCIALILTPEKFTEFDTVNFQDDKKRHEFANKYERTFIGLSSFVAMLAIMNISLMWLSTAETVMRLRKPNRRVNIKGQLIFYRRIIYFVEATWLIVAFSVWLKSSALVLFASVGYLLLISGSYIFGYIRLAALLKSNFFSANSANSQTVTSASPTNVKDRIVAQIIIRAMRRTTITVLFGVVVLFAFGMAYALMSILHGGWEYYSPRDKVSPVMATNEFIPVGILIGLAGVLTFVRANVTQFGQMKSSALGGLHDSEAVSRSSIDPEELAKYEMEKEGNLGELERDEIKIEEDQRTGRAKNRIASTEKKIISSLGFNLDTQADL